MLRNRIVCITGAAGGFGQAFARAFIGQGAHLALLDNNAPALDALARELRRSGGSVQAVVADLGSAEGVRAGIDAVLAPYGHLLDIFIANVGVLVAGPFEEVSEASIEEAMRINFLTHVWACRAVLPRMREREGATIVLVGSDQGSQPDSGLFPYAQAKAALHSLTKALAREYGPAIRVNAVAPGVSRTPLVEELMERLAHDEFQTDCATAERIELRRRGVPLARLGEPEEVAEAVLFLAQNGFCTGTILDISGGNVRGV